jgi:RNA polymerase sigma-70 factor (ECF subfamily)
MLMELPEGTRTVFNLFVVDGFSHKEIGEMLGISDQTSKWHTKIARKKLKELLKLELSHEAR